MNEQSFVEVFICFGQALRYFFNQLKYILFQPFTGDA